MQVFLLGATGYIGTAVVEKLQAAGHRITGLVRSEKSAKQLQDRGCEPYLGDIFDIDRVVEGARRADVTINLASASGVGKDFDAEKAFKADQELATALIDALGGTDKAVIYTSGSLAVADMSHGDATDQTFDEDTPFNPPSFMASRVETDRMLLEASVRGVRTIILRAPLVYGRGGSFFVPALFEIALQKGSLCFVGKGENIWSTVHVDDLADLYVLAMERASAGELFNAASGEVTMKEIVEAVGRTVGCKSQGLEMEQASNLLGDLVASVVGTNSRITAAKARQILGWNPKMPSMLEDIENGSYRARYAKNA